MPSKQKVCHDFFKSTSASKNEKLHYLSRVVVRVNKNPDSFIAFTLCGIPLCKAITWPFLITTG
jgi:hypothetical protein